MTRSSLLGFAGYFVAAVLVFLPLLDILMSVQPMSMGDMTWRFATIGVLAGAVMTVILGMFLALAVAVHLEQRRMVKLTGMLSVLGVVAFLGFMAMFLLDAMGMRALVNPEAQAAFGVASVAALFKHGCGALGLGLVALAARAESKALAASSSGRRSGGIVSSASRKSAAEAAETG